MFSPDVWHIVFQNSWQYWCQHKTFLFFVCACLKNGGGRGENGFLNGRKWDLISGGGGESPQERGGGGRKTKYDDKSMTIGLLSPSFLFFQPHAYSIHQGGGTLALAVSSLLEFLNCQSSQDSFFSPLLPPSLTTAQPKVGSEAISNLFSSSLRPISSPGVLGLAATEITAPISYLPIWLGVAKGRGGRKGGGGGRGEWRGGGAGEDLLTRDGNSRISPPTLCQLYVLLHIQYHLGKKNKK